MACNFAPNFAPRIIETMGTERASRFGRVLWFKGKIKIRYIILYLCYINFELFSAKAKWKVD